MLHQDGLEQRKALQSLEKVIKDARESKLISEATADQYWLSGRRGTT